MQLFDYTLGEILEQWAFETPDSEFIVYPDRDLRFTYKQFNARVDQLAKGLIYIGVSSGDKVGIWAKNVPDWTTLFFATAKIGAVLVPININCNLVELKYLLQNADINTLFFDNGCNGNNFVEIVEELLPELKSQARGVLKSELFPELKNVVFVGQKKYRGMYNSAELILLGSHIDDIELESVKVLVNCHNVFTMQYNSPATGSPKGVMLSHYNIINSGFSVGECTKYSLGERLLVCVPLFHTFGNVLGICSIVVHGATLVFIEDFDRNLVLTALEKESCHAIYGTRELFSDVLNYDGFHSFNLASLRSGMLFGANLDFDTINEMVTKMHLKDIVVVYGTNESSAGVTATRPHNSIETHIATIGFELPNVEVKIANGDTGKTCATGEQGEICCRGYNVMKGYYKNPEATNKVIDPDGWLHTGDLALKTGDGYFVR